MEQTKIDDVLEVITDVLGIKPFDSIAEVKKRYGAVREGHNQYYCWKMSNYKLTFNTRAKNVNRAIHLEFKTAITDKEKQAIIPQLVEIMQELNMCIYMPTYSHQLSPKTIHRFIAKNNVQDLMQYIRSQHLTDFELALLLRRIGAELCTRICGPQNQAEEDDEP